MTEPAGPGALSVAAVTFANGGGNIGVYVPVFTQSSPGGLATYVVVFWSLSPSGARQDACSPPGRSSPVR